MSIAQMSTQKVGDSQETSLAELGYVPLAPLVSQGICWYHTVGAAVHETIRQ